MATDSTKTENDSKPEKEDAVPEKAVPEKDGEREEREETREGAGDGKTAAHGDSADGKSGDDVKLSKDEHDKLSKDEHDDDDDDDLDDLNADLAVAHSAGGRGWGAGGAAVVSAGIGLASLTGTSFSEMLRERKQLIGQIESGAQGGAGGDQINALYGAPWHASAMINGIFALVAVLIGGLLLAALSGRSDTRPWVKAVALGGLVLGVIGLVVSGGMYFDLFASAPELPAQGVGGAPGQ